MLGPIVTVWNILCAIIGCKGIRKQGFVIIEQLLSIVSFIFENICFQGQRQSPVDIDPKLVLFDPQLPDLYMTPSKVCKSDGIIQNKYNKNPN